MRNCVIGWEYNVILIEIVTDKDSNNWAGTFILGEGALRMPGFYIIIPEFILRYFRISVFCSLENGFAYLIEINEELCLEIKLRFHPYNSNMYD